MILRFSIKNFLSFYKETKFDMFPNPKRTTFPDHVYKDVKIPLLKQAAIYGANGSGKSNFVDAFFFLKLFTTEKDFLKESMIERSKFRLVESENREPISFLIEFYYQGKYFIYTVQINSNKIEQEELYLSGLGEKENEIIFKRSGGNFSAPSAENFRELREATEKLIRLNPLSSLLALNTEFPLFKDSRAKIAYKWFNEQLDVIKINSTVPMLIDLMSANKKLLNFANEIFSKTGVGIGSVKINSQPFDQWISDKDENLKEVLQKKTLKPNMGLVRIENNKNLYSVSLEKGIRTVKEFIFEQFGQNGFHGNMGIQDQSDGTVRLLTLIPALFNAVENKKVVCIDEFDNSIHPTLMMALMEYFSGIHTNGQLIFTTHETCLLNQQKFMRPDEVWFAEKNEGATRMYSLNDFKEHNTISIEKGYLQGRYGAIPFIGNLGE